MDKSFAAPNDSHFLTQRLRKAETDIGLIKREPYQRDRDRIIHSRAFRRLMHKTQIFNANKGDHYRNRLTHSLEVSQIARSIGKGLSLNDELIEAIAIGHDLGHTPFGHVGERTIHMILTGETFDDEEISIPGNEGFKHNYQGLQIVDNIETSSDEYDGMNLTLAVREGILKHTGRKINIDIIKEDGVSVRRQDTVRYRCLDLKNIDIEKPSFTLEGQVVAIADEIAQCTHDLEDGIRSGIISINNLKEIELVKKIIIDRGIIADKIKTTIDARNTLIKVMVGYLIDDVYCASKTILAEKYKDADVPEFKDINDVYNDKLITFSIGIKDLVESLSKQIVQWILVSQQISQSDSKAEYFIKQLFKAYYKHPLELPDYILKRYYSKIGKEYSRVRVRDDIAMLRNDIDFVRLICDHIGSMTDQYVEREYKKLYLPDEFVD